MCLISLLAIFLFDVAHRHNALSTKFLAYFFLMFQMSIFLSVWITTMIWVFFCTIYIFFTFSYFCLYSCVLFALQLTSIHSFGKKTKSLTVFRRCELYILSSHFPSSILKYTSSHYLAVLFLTFLFSMAHVLVGLCQDIGCGGD